MKIQAGNRYIPRYIAGLGSNVSFGKVKDLSDTNKNVNEKTRIGVPISPPKPVYSFIKPPNISEIKRETIDEELVTDNESLLEGIDLASLPENINLDDLAEAVALNKRNGEIHQAKIEKMEEMLKSLGIEGKLTASSMQTAPQSYTMYYIETADANKQNTVIFELENGELVFGETSLNQKDFWEAFDKFCVTELSGGEKRGVDEMKGLLAEFFGANEMKRL